MALAGDGTSDLYAGGRIFEVNNHVPTNGQIRVNDTGALDSIYAPTVSMLTLALAPAGDGSGDVLVFGPFGERGVRLCRLNRHGAVVSTFHEPIIDREVFTIVPALDGTGDIYLGGAFTTNGQVVNRIARIHADGTLASAGSSTP